MGKMACGQKQKINFSEKFFRHSYFMTLLINIRTIIARQHMKEELEIEV